MRPTLQKHSALKRAGRIILHKQGFNTPQLAAEPVSKACFWVHTRDLIISMFIEALRILFVGMPFNE
jgi:hypothetical protein